MAELPVVNVHVTAAPHYAQAIAERPGVARLMLEGMAEVVWASMNGQGFVFIDPDVQARAGRG